MNFDDFKKFTKVLVTGPQRSGTTIASHILSKELNYKYYDERDVNVRSCSKLFELLLNNECLVVQGPCFCSIVHWIDSPNTCVVIMKRNIQDIITSEKRINWNEELRELKNYFQDDGIISQVRYKNWDKYQKEKMKVPFFELEYESLSNHPMWLNRDLRKNFRREIA